MTNYNKVMKAVELTSLKSNRKLSIFETKFLIRKLIQKITL